MTVISLLHKGWLQLGTHLLDLVNQVEMLKTWRRRRLARTGNRYMGIDTNSGKLFPANSFQLHVNLQNLVRRYDAEHVMLGLVWAAVLLKQCEQHDDDSQNLGQHVGAAGLLFLGDCLV